MLFHITMTHTPDNCPAYHRETMPDVIAGMDKLEGVAQELNIKVHFLLWAAPDHVAYALLEADSLGVIAQYVNALPIRQEFRVTPVEHLQQVIETSRAMMARAKK
ncbi:MAG: hypothetical protein HY870_14155 [Chloroflexi bacterium]|nr:hypothetical protein [Chloroflexota bacterium]